MLSLLEYVAANDVPPLLAMVAAAAGADRRSHWCEAAAGRLCRLLGAQAALVLDVVPAGSGHRVADFLDVGLASHADRALIVRTLGEDRIAEPFLRAALQKSSALKKSAVVLGCVDLRGKISLRRSVFCSRRPGASFADCLISVASLSSAGKLARHRSAILFFKTKSDFSPREKVLLAICHPTLAEICAGRLRESPQHLAALSPRLREALRHLSTGRSERAIARRMKLSYHTVHGYAKELYAHFAVTSRRELIARWSRVAGKG